MDSLLLERDLLEAFHLTGVEDRQRGAVERGQLLRPGQPVLRRPAAIIPEQLAPPVELLRDLRRLLAGKEQVFLDRFVTQQPEEIAALEKLGRRLRIRGGADLLE